MQELCPRLRPQRKSRRPNSPAPPSGANIETQQVQTTKIECSRGLADWLVMNNVSLAFTSYQTGQLFLIGALPDKRISIHQRNFIRAMGLISPARSRVRGLDRSHLAARKYSYDGLSAQISISIGCFVPRNAQITGDLDVHELAVDKHGRIIFVNTKYSCLRPLTRSTASGRSGSQSLSRSSLLRIAVI